MDVELAEPARRGAVMLDGGRQLAWAEWGASDGSPVLFFSGAAMGGDLGFGSRAVDRLGVRLIGVERPGIGRSDPDPGRTLVTWVEDVRALADQLQVAAVGIVGFSQGAPFALACAASGVAHAVAVVAGQDDVADPATLSRLDPEVQSLVRAVAADPAMVEDTFRRTADPELLWRLAVDTSSPVDRAVYEQPAFAAAYRRALDAGLAHAGAGYARDLVLAIGRWPFDVSGIRVPVVLWYGAHDASTVHSPDHGATLAARIPTARRHVVPDAGSSVLWTHADAILASLAP
jgi:pimeloyl-ACP methyl ester carboxylesterase